MHIITYYMSLVAFRYVFSVLVSQALQKVALPKKFIVCACSVLTGCLTRMIIILKKDHESKRTNQNCCSKCIKGKHKVLLHILQSFCNMKRVES